MADWWDVGDFNLGGGGGGFDFGNWWDPGQFNLDFNFPSYDFGNFGFDPSQFNLGFDPGSFNFNFTDPLALPSLDFGGGFQSAFNPGQGLDTSGLFQPTGTAGAGASPMQLSDLGFGGSNAPQTALPNAAPAQTSDPFLNLMGSDQGQGLGGWPGADWTGGGLGDGSALTGGGQYTDPFSSKLDLGNYAGQGGTDAAASPAGPASLQDLQRQLLQGQIAQLDKANKPASSWDTLAKLAAAFGPTALGAAGLGLQASNQPKRNPLEDDLLRARIASSGQQDALAKDRLDFEKSNAEAMRQAQMEMQNALLESRKPGGQGNIDALLKGNPQLAALYQALTKQTTGLASGDSPEFNALIEQVAQVDIAELQRQAQQQMAQAQEMAARQGINPANIIAEIQQRVLQESAKARANARQTIISQLQPGISTFNSIGSLFGNLFQTPSAG